MRYVEFARSGDLNGRLRGVPIRIGGAIAAGNEEISWGDVDRTSNEGECRCPCRRGKFLVALHFDALLELTPATLADLGRTGRRLLRQPAGLSTLLHQPGNCVRVLTL